MNKRVRFNNKVPDKIRKRINSFNYLSVKYYKKGLGSDEYSRFKKHGAFGIYYKISNKLGVKVYKPSWYKLAGRKDKQSLIYYSETWKNAIKEFNTLVQVQESGFAPIPYAIKPIRVGRKWYAAIFMEHINGRVCDCTEWLEDLDGQMRSILKRSIREKVNILRTKFDCTIFDHDGNNMILTPDFQIKFIDFGSEGWEWTDETGT